MTANVAFVGGVMLGRNVAAGLSGAAPASVWGTTLPLLRTADAVIANLVCSISDEVQRWSRPDIAWVGMTPTTVKALRAGNVRCVSLATPLSEGCSEDAVLKTLDQLRKGGIAYAGIGRTPEEAARPAVFRAGNLNIGFAACTDEEPRFTSGMVTNYTPLRADVLSLDRVSQVVSSCHHAGADFVVLSVHRSPSMLLDSANQFRRFAHASIERGVDLVYGHSGHVFEEVEIHDGKAILYDSGDFLDDYVTDPSLRNDQSFIVMADLRAGRAKALRLVPVMLSGGRVNLARGSDRTALIDAMLGRCREVGTETSVTAGEIEIEMTHGTGAPVCGTSSSALGRSPEIRSI